MNADEVRRENRALDDALLAAAGSLDESRLRESTDPESWSAAEVLAHLGEFPRFFASELRRFAADPSATIGRTHEHDERLAAVASAHGRGLADLRADAEAALAELAGTLDELGEFDPAATTQNVKYGAEPLQAFLDRYVLGHKRGHLEQLRATPAAAPPG